MKKVVSLIILVLGLAVLPSDAAPGGAGMAGGARAPMRAGVSAASHSGMVRPSVNRTPAAVRTAAPRPAITPARAPVYVAGRHPLPPLYRPYRPIIRPYYYSSIYYPIYYSTAYTYYPYSNYIYYDDADVDVAPAAANTVVVRDDYAGINTAANVVNAAANVAATIRYLTW